MNVYYSKRKNGKTVYKKHKKPKNYRWEKAGFKSSRSQQFYYSVFAWTPYCSKCGICNQLHKLVFGYNLSIDHINNNPLDNFPFNLQTLCFICHYLKDQSFRIHFMKMLLKREKKRILKEFEKLIKFRSVYFKEK